MSVCAVREMSPHITDPAATALLGAPPQVGFAAKQRLLEVASTNNDIESCPQPPMAPEAAVQQADVSADQAASLARVAYKCGKYREAAAWADRALVGRPQDAKLLHLRGQCLASTGNIPGAFTSFMSALGLSPGCPQLLLDLAGLYKGRGLLAEARLTLEQGLAAAPGDAQLSQALAVVLNDLGTAAKTQGDTAEAHRLYTASLSACPTYAAAHYNLGVLASEGKQWEEALAAYGAALEAAPGYAQAQCNRGVVLKELGRLEEAVGAYEAALAAAPNLAVVRTNLAIALSDLGTAVKARGDLPGAINLYERALALSPRYADAHYNLGVAQAEAGQPGRAALSYQLAVEFNPGCAEAWNNLGVLYKDGDNLERAAECYMAALQIRPNFPQSLNNLGVVATSQGRASEALALLSAATAADPAYAEAWNNLGVLQRDVGAIPQAIASYERSLELAANNRNAGQNRLLALNYVHHGEDPAVCAAHQQWGEGFAAQFTQLPLVSPADWDTTPGRPLRVGYVSPDLFTHSVSYFAEAPLRHHSAAGGRGVHHIVYCVAPKVDAKTQLLREAVEAAGGEWHMVVGLSEVELAARVRQDKVDILVELTGHTAHNRLGVMAQRPAPVQVTWIGYPNSTGLGAVDYRLTDARADPWDTTQTFVEQLVRLPGCFLCYTPALDAPPVSPTPGLANGFITFGSFNNLAKITPRVLEVWAAILDRVPGSRLVLKNKPFADEAVRAQLAGRLTALGVAPWRVDLLPLAPANADHLATYALMDISLDPWPYAGTTTTTESLYMGVPCITLAGACHAHNVGVSLLAALDMDSDWVATSEEQYIQLAVQQAADVAALQQLRQGLRQRMLSSPLCDGPGFVRGLEQVYHQMWEAWVSGGGAGRLVQVPPAGDPQGATLREVTDRAAGAAVGAAVAASSPAARPPAAAEQQQVEGQEGDTTAATTSSSSRPQQLLAATGAGALAGGAAGAAAGAAVGAAAGAPAVGAAAGAGVGASVGAAAGLAVGVVTSSDTPEEEEEEEEASEQPLPEQGSSPPPPAAAGVEMVEMRKSKAGGGGGGGGSSQGGSSAAARSLADSSSSRQQLGPRPAAAGGVKRALGKDPGQLPAVVAGADNAAAVQDQSSSKLPDGKAGVPRPKGSQGGNSDSLGTSEGGNTNTSSTRNTSGTSNSQWTLLPHPLASLPLPNTAGLDLLEEAVAAVAAAHGTSAVAQAFLESAGSPCAEGSTSPAAAAPPDPSSSSRATAGGARVHAVGTSTVLASPTHLSSSSSSSQQGGAPGGSPRTRTFPRGSSSSKAAGLIHKLQVLKGGNTVKA